MCEVASDVFVRNLKNLMIKHKLNQYTLAEKIGCSQPSIGNYMRGDGLPSLQMVNAICKAFDISAHELFNPNEEQFGEQVSKEEEILELKQEIIRRNVQIDELNKKLASATPIEVPKDDKVKVFMEDDGTVITINGKDVDFDCIEKVDIYNKTIVVQLKFDELSVK